MWCIQSYNVKPSPRPSGSGVQKIPFIPKFFNELIFNGFILVCHKAQYFMSMFLWGTHVCNGVCHLQQFLLFVVIIGLGPVHMPSLLWLLWLLIPHMLGAEMQNMPHLLTAKAL